LVRTCRISSFCTVAWQLARFPLTRRIARSLGDSWASCLWLWVAWGLPSVLWRCWFGDRRKDIRPIKTGVVTVLVACWRGCLERGADLHIGNESAPIQLAQCWFPGLAISNAKILIHFSNKNYGSNFFSNSTRKLLWFEIAKMLIVV